MHPIALQFGSLTIRWYGVMAALAFLSAVFLTNRNRRYAALSEKQCSDILILALISGVIGARIFYFIQFFDQFRGEVWRIVRIDQGGLVFYGGFLLALCTVLIYAKKQAIDAVRLLDVLAPSMALAHAFGRIGCFLNGCCYGRATTLWWGVTPPPGSNLSACAGTLPIHPVQLVEAGENLLLALLYCWLLRKKLPRGVVSGCFLIFYGTLRIFNEMMRGDNVLYFHLTPAQWIGAMLIPAGIGLLIVAFKNGKKI